MDHNMKTGKLLYTLNINEYVLKPVQSYVYCECPVCVCVFLCCFSSRQEKDWLPPEALWFPAACGNHGALPGYKPPVCTDKQTWRAKINYSQAHPCMLWRLGTFPALNVTIYEASAVTTYFMRLLIVTHERFAQISLKEGDGYSLQQ